MTRKIHIEELSEIPLIQSRDAIFFASAMMVRIGGFPGDSGRMVASATELPLFSAVTYLHCMLSGTKREYLFSIRHFH